MRSLRDRYDGPGVGKGGRGALTVFGLFLTPVFYYAIRRLVERKAGAGAPAAEAAVQAQQPHPPA
jgi:hypothetical protein